jgi:hypothetical protein
VPAELGDAQRQGVVFREGALAGGEAGDGRAETLG